jgi:hypothetical protein
MAIQRRVNWISQQRANVDDLRGIESAASNDWDQAVQALITGTAGVAQSNGNSGGYIIRGFEILMSGAIGGAASALQMQVDPGSLMHTTSSQSGTVYMVPPGTANQQLNGATNTNVIGAFVPNSFNYIGLDYERSLDTTTDAQVYIWDPTSNTETTAIAPRANIMSFEIIITTSTWASNVIPIAIVETDAGNNVLSVTDSRWLLLRLATGGASPNPFYVYPWTAQSEGRTENPSTSTSNNVNPFEGGDKMLFSLKDWMNAVMSELLEVKGTVYWYSPVSSSGSLQTLRQDLGLTVFTGNSTISHGILPNSIPVLTTTGDINATNQLSSLASTTGIVANQVIMGSAGIPTNTTVLSLLSSTVTMSQNALSTMTGITVSFYSPLVVTAPGQINWSSNPTGDGQLHFKLIGSQLDYEIVENPTGDSVTLLDNQVAYITLTRGIEIAPNLIFTSGSPTVASVGSVIWTSSLQAGDWIKQATDTDAGYYQILSVNSPSQVTLTENYGEATSPSGGVVADYAFGTYTLPGQTGTPRDMVIAYRYNVPISANVVWLFLRSDDSGSTPRVYIKFLGAELQNGESQEISGPTLDNVLQYIGSPTESAVFPEYVASIYSGAVPEITSITTSAASAMSSNQYFFINSSGNSRQYYVWVNANGTGTDPKPFANGTPIEWDVSTGQTATQTAVALVNALNATFYDDFTASYVSSTLTVTNNSAGTANAASNFDVGGLTISETQAGTGPGNYSMNDGDNLTVAIKKIDDVLGGFLLSLDQPGYDETVTVVASGATPPTSITGPVSPGTNIQLPPNSREAFVQAYYTVGQGKIEVFLNGQKMILGNDYNEVGNSDTASDFIQTLIELVVGDELEFLFNAGGGGAGGGGGIGPQGPPGPSGPAGSNAVGGPISISTKTGPTTYTVLSTDNVLLADATAGTVTLNLPSSSSSTGRVFWFKKVDASSNPMVIVANGFDMIDGASTQSTIVQYTSFTLITDGSGNWYNF